MPKILPQKKLLPLLTAVLSVGLFFLLAEPARAGVITDTALEVFGAIVGIVVDVLGQLLLLVISVLITVAQFNNFIASPPVQEGWAIVRDICNMFFVLVLLLVAFATILHLQNYSVKQLFKRVIIFAILINFSKLFCGLIIDFSQVVMLTFVNAFKDIGGGNFSMLLGVDQLLAIDAQDFKNGADFWSIIGSYVLALIYVVIMLVVMVALLATLVYRIVMLWIYIILSPLAYLANIVPLMQGVSKQWWSQFFQQVATGPLLAFFIWLSLATLGQFSNSNQDWAREMKFGNPDTPKNANLTSPSVGITQVGTVDHMLRFVVSLGLLIGGLVVSKSFGGSAGAAISKVVGGAQKGAGWMKRNVGKVAKPVAKYAAQKTWQGSKALGRGGLALAKTVDYGATVRGGKILQGVANRFRAEENRKEFKYEHEQGILSRFGAGVRQNAFTKQGWKENFNGLTRKMGVETNRRINQQRAAATNAGYHKDEKGVEYFLNKETGKFHTKREAERTYIDKKTGEEKKEKIDVWTDDVWQGPDGKAVKSYGGFGQKMHENLHATKATTAIDNAYTTQQKKEYEEMAAPYMDMSREQLLSLIKGTADPQKLKGMYAALSGKDGDKGAVKDKRMFNEAEKLFAANPDQLRMFSQSVAKKQAELVYDVTNKNQFDAFKKLVAKNKIKLEDQTLATLDFNDPDTKRVAENKEKLADITGAFREAMHKERWGNAINKIDKEGDSGVAKKLAEALGILSNRAESNRDLVKQKSQKRVTEIDEKLVTKDKEIKDKQREIDAADAVMKQTPSQANAKKVADLIKEREDLAKQKDVLSGQKKHRKGKLDDVDQKVYDKLNREVMSLRSDRLTLDLEGDFIKSFTSGPVFEREEDGTTKKDANGNPVVSKKPQFDAAMAGEFLATASGKQLAQINPASLLKSPEAIAMAANNVSFEKLKNLERSGSNPELARMIAQAKVKNNDPEAEKIVNLYNDIEVNMDNSKFNKAIQEALKAGGKKNMNLDDLNKMREHVAKDPRINNANLDMDDKDDKKTYKSVVSELLDGFEWEQKIIEAADDAVSQAKKAKEDERKARIKQHQERVDEAKKQSGEEEGDEEDQDEDENT